MLARTLVRRFCIERCIEICIIRIDGAFDGVEYLASMDGYFFGSFDP
jgi:hypothetical protein